MQGKWDPVIKSDVAVWLASSSERQKNRISLQLVSYFWSGFYRGDMDVMLRQTLRSSLCSYDLLVLAPLTGRGPYLTFEELCSPQNAERESKVLQNYTYLSGSRDSSTVEYGNRWILSGPSGYRISVQQDHQRPSGGPSGKVAVRCFSIIVIWRRNIWTFLRVRMFRDRSHVENLDCHHDVVRAFDAFCIDVNKVKFNNEWKTRKRGMGCSEIVRKSSNTIISMEIL